MRRVTHRVFMGTACLLMAAGSASAQTVTAGVKAGLALTSVPHAGDVLDQVSGVDSVDVRAKLGVTGGGFVQFAFTEQFSLQPELLFVMKGVKLDLPVNEGTVSASISYIEFPILARYTRALNDRIDGYILGGPTFALKAGTSSTFNGVNRSEVMNIDPAFRSRDIGLSFGGGIERSVFLLEARYTLGLTDVATTFYEHADALRNRAFSVMIGIRVP